MLSLVTGGGGRRTGIGSGRGAFAFFAPAVGLEADFASTGFADGRAGVAITLAETAAGLYATDDLVLDVFAIGATGLGAIDLGAADLAATTFAATTGFFAAISFVGFATDCTARFSTLAASGLALAGTLARLAGCFKAFAGFTLATGLTGFFALIGRAGFVWAFAGRVDLAAGDLGLLAACGFLPIFFATEVPSLSALARLPLSATDSATTANPPGASQRYLNCNCVSSWQ